MAQGCRICEKTLALGAECTEFSTVVADVNRLLGECAEIEMDLYDSFNAFCFTCRNISMSVPVGTPGEQVCYLRSQVTYFQALQTCRLINPGNKNATG